MRTKHSLLILTMALAASCKSAGSGPTDPVAPTYRLVDPPPCLTAPPAAPGPVLLGAPQCEDGVEGRCPALTDEQIRALWAFANARDKYAWRAWSCEEARARRARGRVPGPGGQGSDAGAARPER